MAENREAPGASQALSAGFVFALMAVNPLLFFAAGPLLLKAVATMVVWWRPLHQQELFLVWVILAVADSWQMTAVGMYCFERFRGVIPDPLSLVRRALENLPKVFLSYACIVALVFASYTSSMAGSASSALSRAMVAFILVFSLFFVWAPAFVVGEFFSKEEADEEDDEDDEGVDDEEYYLARIRRPRLYFTNQAVWNLGLERSYSFSLQHFGATSAIIVLFWTAEVVPAAIAKFAFGFQLSSLLAETALSSFAASLTIAAAAVTFINLLPGEAQREVGLAPNAMSPIVARRRGAGPAALLALCFLASAVSSAYLFGAMQRQYQMPENVSSELNETLVREKKLILTVKLNDPERRYRWLEPASFSLKAAGEEKVFTPVRWIVLDEQGRDISSVFRPRQGPLRVVLTFEHPEEFHDKKPVLNYPGRKDPIAEIEKLQN